MSRPDERLVFENPYEVIEWLTRIIGNSEAQKVTSKRLGDAHAYVQKYCMPKGWGKNVWHTILDDALALREELNKQKQ